MNLVVGAVGFCPPPAARPRSMLSCPRRTPTRLRSPWPPAHGRPARKKVSDRALRVASLPTGWLRRSGSSCAETRRSHEDVQWEQGAHQQVWYIYHLADAQIYRYAAQRVGLLTVEPSRLEVLDHVEQGILGREAQILTLVGAVFVHPDAGSGEEPARGGQLRGGEVVVAEILQVLDAAPLCFALPDPEAQMHASPHLYRCPAGLAVALRVMDIAG